jgi:hypothetical protein
MHAFHKALTLLRCNSVLEIAAESKVPYAGFVGDMRISYAKFLQLLEHHRIKRLIIYGDMRTAIVEVRCCFGVILMLFNSAFSCQKSALHTYLIMYLVMGV